MIPGMTTATNADLRVAVVGAGRMGADHIRRITERISGARVSAVVEPDADRAAAAVAAAPGARAFADLTAAIDADAVDAVLIATPGAFHEAALLAALDAGLPTLCEKPLTPDAESSRRIVDREQQLDRPHIQVGFMRRFDAEYQALRREIDAGGAGELLMLHCVHRNPDVLPDYVASMLITDSVVHELDVVPWLAGSPIRTIEVRHGRPNRLSPEGLREPILVLLELENGVLADVEMNVSAQFGYQVATEAVFEKGVARIGQPAGLHRWSDGAFTIGEHVSFVTRFARAYDDQVQRWVTAVREGSLVDGPTAWDAYGVALACEAGVAALGGGVVPVITPPRPEFYA
jgi:myo-inositol 2-dehydrogenase/D-chiro-inositol 1-dehydrogenase